MTSNDNTTLDDEASEEDEPTNPQECPYCGSPDGCEHLLLTIDTTFRTAVDGKLYEEFNEQWSDIADQSDPGFDEQRAFEELLEKVDALASFSTHYDFEGGPGMSSSCVLYWSSSKEALESAMQDFRARSDS